MPLGRAGSDSSRGAPLNIEGGANGKLKKNLVAVTFARLTKIRLLFGAAALPVFRMAEVLGLLLK